MDTPKNRYCALYSAAMTGGLFFLSFLIGVSVDQTILSYYQEPVFFVVVLVMLGFFFIKGQQLYDLEKPLLKEIAGGMIFLLIVYLVIFLYTTFVSTETTT